MKGLNNKAQALIEFVLVLPILLFIFFAIIDLGRVFIKKMEIEDLSNEIVEYVSDGKGIKEIEKIIKDTHKKEIIITSRNDKKYKYFTFKEETELFTPGLNLIMGDPYYIEVERVIPND